MFVIISIVYQHTPLIYELAKKPCALITRYYVFFSGLVPWMIGPVEMKVVILVIVNLSKDMFEA